MQTATELPRMEVQLPEFDYSNTLVRRNSFKERPAEPPHPCFRKPGDGPGDAALDLEGARAKISGTNIWSTCYLTMISCYSEGNLVVLSVDIL